MVLTTMVSKSTQLTANQTMTKSKLPFFFKWCQKDKRRQLFNLFLRFPTGNEVHIEPQEDKEAEQLFQINAK